MKRGPEPAIAAGLVVLVTILAYGACSALGSIGTIGTCCRRPSRKGPQASLPSSKSIARWSDTSMHLRTASWVQRPLAGRLPPS